MKLNKRRKKLPTREIVLLLEVSGIYPNKGDKIVEIACVELINHRPTGHIYHQYINPQKKQSPEMIAVHGLTDNFLADKPTFKEIIADFLKFMGNDSTVVIQNARFAVEFLNAELAACGKSTLKNPIIDTLALARQKFPGKENHLTALCERFHIDVGDRAFHGVLLDTELLSEVYLKLLAPTKNRKNK